MASVYYTLLNHQITLATIQRRQITLTNMEYKRKDSRHVKLFWNFHNDASKEVNNTTLKYETDCWCSDIAGYIFYFNLLSFTFWIMLHKNEQNASKKSAGIKLQENRL